MVTDKKNLSLRNKNYKPPVSKGMPVSNGSATTFKLLTILTFLTRALRVNSTKVLLPLTKPTHNVFSYRSYDAKFRNTMIRGGQQKI
jgi:hypothetical protein